MPIQKKTSTEQITRGEAQILIRYLVDKLKNPPPKGGFYHLLHRTPQDVAKEYKISVSDVITAMRRTVED